MSGAIIAQVGLGDSFIRNWEVPRSDGNGLVTPLVQGDFTTRLYRDAGGIIISASESVDIAEQVTGSVEVKVTPSYSGYYALYMDEEHVDSYERKGILWEFITTTT